MASIEGDEAFTLILDRLIDAEKRATGASDRADESGALHRETVRNFDSEKAAHGKLKSKIAADAPKLLKFHEAASAVVTILRQGHLPPPDKLEELRIAMNVAAEPCGNDDIPF